MSGANYWTTNDEVRFFKRLCHQDKVNYLKLYPLRINWGEIDKEEILHRAVMKMPKRRKGARRKWKYQGK